MLSPLVWIAFAVTRAPPALDPADGGARGQATIAVEESGLDVCGEVPLLGAAGGAAFGADALLIAGVGAGMWTLTSSAVPENLAWIAPVLLTASPLLAGALIFMVPWALENHCGNGRALDTGAASVAAFLGAGIGGAVAGGLAGYLGGWLYGTYVPRTPFPIVGGKPHDAPHYYAMEGAALVALGGALAMAPVGAATAAWAMSRVAE